MRVNLRNFYNTVWGLKDFQMEMSMSETMIMDNQMDMASITGTMEIIIKGIL